MAALVRVLRRPVGREALCRSLDESFDRVGEMDFLDCAIAALNTKLMGSMRNTVLANAIAGATSVIMVALTAVMVWDSIRG